MTFTLGKHIAEACYAITVYTQVDHPTYTLEANSPLDLEGSLSKTRNGNRKTANTQVLTKVSLRKCLFQVECQVC